MMIKNALQKLHLIRSLSLAVLCAICMILLLPVPAGALSAHAILVRADPAKDAVLQIPPTQVHLWFSEDLNPTLSTAQVLNAARKRVDNSDAHINANDSKEMDLTLNASLPPDVYVVVWRTDSVDDGHVLLGSFLFTVENPDGTVPRLATGANPALGVLGNTGLTNTGTLDAPGFFSLFAITLAELGAIFWVGAQFWLNFVLQTSSEKDPDEVPLNAQLEQRFARRFSLPTLTLLLIANLGVLYGQALTLTGGDWGAAFSMRLLTEQATSGRFGTYWTMRMLVLLLALATGIYVLLSQKRSRASNQLLPLLNLFLGAILFVAMTMSGHAASVSSVLLPYSAVLDWLHLIAAALWVGGMIYILLIYLPVLQTRSPGEQARSLLSLLPRYSPLAIAGVVIMAISGPLTATFHLTSIEQFLTTAYGRTLLIKIVLVGALLITSACHVLWLRPRLKKEYQKYTYTRGRLKKMRISSAASPEEELSGSTKPEQNSTPGAQTPVAQNPAGGYKLLEQQVRLREERVARRAGMLTHVLRWEPWMGVAVIVCVGLMNVFAGTLTPTSTQQPSSTNTVVVKPFNSTAQTTDGKYAIALTVSPNRFGPNVFTVTVTDNQTGRTLGPDQVGVTLYTTMLDMAMGTESINLQSNGKGGFSATGDLQMPGNWELEVQMRTLDNKLHQASFKLATPY